MKLGDDIFRENEERNFGFLAEKGRIKFLIPEMLKPSKENETFTYLKKYNQILLKYSRSKKNEYDFNSSSNGEKEIENLNIISAYLNILDDYFNNDTFFLFEKYYKKGEKKINWSKTLKENNVIISNNNIIYNSFISNRSELNNYNQYYALYREALRQSKSLFLGLIDDEVIFSQNKNEQKYHIYKYIEEHFRDRELFIAENLRVIYLYENWHNINNTTFEFKYHLKFENIWQEMISQVTKINRSPVRIKKTKYKKSNFDGLGLRHDHFLNINKNYYLLDSKFYRSYENKKFPASEDIGKQFMYKYMIAKQKSLSLDEIHNYFIFPKNNPENRAPELFEIHISEDFPETNIYCIALDIDNVIEHYIKDSIYKDFLNILENTKDIKPLDWENKEKINEVVRAPNIRPKTEPWYLYQRQKDRVNARVWLYQTTTNDFIVKENSQGFRAKEENLLKLQKELESQGIITWDRNEKLFVFTKTHKFTSREDGFAIINGDSNQSEVDKWKQQKKNKSYYR